MALSEARLADIVAVVQRILPLLSDQPLLGDKELGVELSTGKVKIGDGVTAWADLPYLSQGGSGSPGGADTDVQYNDGGDFGGDSNLTWDKTTQVLALASGSSIQLDGAMQISSTLQVTTSVQTALVNATTVNATDVQAETVTGEALVAVATTGNGLLNLQSSDGENYSVSQATVNTINNTTTTIETITPSASTIEMVEARIVGRRTGGSAGSANDGAGFILVAVFKPDGSLIGTVEEVVAKKSNSNVSASITSSGGNILVRVTGDTNNNYTWDATIIRQGVSS